MASNAVNTRQHERYHAASLPMMELSPAGSQVSVPARLLDLNRNGGMGLLVDGRGDFDKISLATFLSPWMVTRHTSAGPVNVEIRIFNAFPRFYEGKQGIRLSVLPNNKATGKNGAKFFFGARRKSRRSPKNQMVVRLQRGMTQLSGQLVDVGDDDGIGLSLTPSTLHQAMWGEIFSDGWEITSAEKSMSCFIQRLALQAGAIIVGAVAPGMTRGWGAKAAATATVASAAAAAAAAGKAKPKEPASSGDDALMELLNQVLKKKSKK